ncbi:MAG: heavy metal-associated domain-containing protein [Kiritimatiellae bacterium]|jgi:copper chaperone CopZ|nr:heavy metal-associated domain-containing protein [Kiritimatiellia bacterium]
MKLIKTTIFMAAVALLMVSCRQHDYRTVKVKVPQMHNADCANIVGQSLTGKVGIDPETISIDLNDKTVKVTYDSMETALKNIEFFIADTGFKAGPIPANQAAREKLPASCK